MAYTQDENNQNQLRSYEIGSGDLEALLDAIADSLIQSPIINTADVENNQKFIHNGQLKIGQGEGVLALYQKDVEANVEDNLQAIADMIVEAFEVSVQQGADDTVSVSIVGGGFEGGGMDITQYIVGEGNPLNISQFIPLSTQKSVVDVDKAEEFLDTNIFELLPSGDTRQSRIIRFFQELNALLPPNPPEFDLDNNGRVDREEGTDNWEGANQYSQDNSISYAQDNQDGNIDEEDAFIHRLSDSANDTNSTRTIQDIYNRVLPYLTDILEEPIMPQDDRPVYENQSSGYLKFRNLNQGIIIRNTSEDFIEGLDPDNLTFLDRTAGQTDDTILPGTGFTITMWVRFLDKVSTGTLFNFGNPTRSENPFGFRLETFVINKDDKIFVTGEESKTFEEYLSNRPNHQGLQGDKQLFKSTNTERFVRLQVREFGDFKTGNDDGLRDSGLGYPNVRKFPNNPPDLNKTDDGQFFGSDERRLINYTHIPEDFSEWYFICATYNPRVDELSSFSPGIYDKIVNGVRLSETPDFWLNHIDPITDNFVANSLFGNKCKVEIISRTDLLRARGFKV
jgi:hypothetical protein